MQRSMPSPCELELWASAARALGDPTRLSVALALASGGPACGCDLAWIVSKDDKLVSHHLRALRSAGAAASKRSGKMVVYELTGPGAALLAALTTPARVATTDGSPR